MRRVHSISVHSCSVYLVVRTQPFRATFPIRSYAYTARMYTHSHSMLQYAQSTILRSCVCVGIVRLPFTLRSYTICHALAPTQFAHYLAIGHGSPCLIISFALFRKRSFQYVNVRSVWLFAPLFVTCTTYVLCTGMRSAVPAHGISLQAICARGGRSSPRTAFAFSRVFALALA